METKSAKFLIEKEMTWQNLGDGVSRQIMGYDGQLMLVKVKFEKGAIGSLHEHFHSQCTYVAGGIFEVTINGETKTLQAGDGFYAAPDAQHGVVCLEAGILMDSFSPMRLDFIQK